MRAPALLGARGRSVWVGLLACLAALAVGCGGDGKGHDGGGRPPSRQASRAQSPAEEQRLPASRAPDDGPALAVGVTEPNPSLVWSPAIRPVLPAFDRWRRQLGRIRPAYYRLVIDWASLQPSADRPANLGAPNGGCMRKILPCAPYEGVRDQLRALASRQREGGWEAVVVITGSPPWAAGPRSGCERVGTESRSRAPSPRALAAYGQLIRDVLDAARAAGAELRWWSAWNEPNRYVTLSPQRARCRPRSKSIATDLYANLVRTLKRALDKAPGDQRYILGDLAGVVDSDLGETTVSEFLRGLPTDLVCGTPVYAQHTNPGAPDPLPAALRALSGHGCRQRHVVWVTQTGALVPRGRRAPTLRSTRRRVCQALHESLLRWYRNPAVTAAFQYTFREDDTYPMGLVDPTLKRPFPALREWQSWGGERRKRPGDPPPKRACES